MTIFKAYRQFIKMLPETPYPIGEFEYGQQYSLQQARDNIADLKRFPKQLKRVLKKMNDGEIDLPYRPDGWSVRQLVHHLADSHMIGYLRMKLAATEDNAIAPFVGQNSWTNFEDSKNGAIRPSLRLLSALHRRWVEYLECLEEEHLEAGYWHPNLERKINIKEAVAFYVWHGRHHLAHIKLVGKHMKKLKQKVEIFEQENYRSSRRQEPSPDGEILTQQQGKKLKGAKTTMEGTAPIQDQGGNTQPEPEPVKNETVPAKRRGGTAEQLARARAVQQAKRDAAKSQPFLERPDAANGTDEKPPA